MKLSFAMWTTKLTGGTRVLFEIISHLAQRGHQVSVTSLGNPSHDWFQFKSNVRFVYPQVSQRANGRVPLSSILSRRLRRMRLPLGLMCNRISGKTTCLPYDFNWIKLLASGIPSDVDVTVATFCFTAFAVHLSCSGVPFYYMQHYEPIFFEDPYERATAERTYSLPLCRIANSSWLLNVLKHRHCVDSYGPIMPAVNMKLFRPVARTGSRGERVIVCLGKSAQWKGLDDLFNALRLLDRNISNLRLVLYGSEPHLRYESPVPCNYETNVTDERLAQIVASAEVVVVPSWYESSPLPPLEAMACGTPVITTRYGTEDFAFDGENALVVQPRHPELLAVAIERLLTDRALWERISAKGLVTASKYTWDKSVDQVVRLFETVRP